MGFWNRKAQPQNNPPEVMRPGTCECEHERCSHVGGKGKCCVGYPPDKEWPDGAECSCQIFILDSDSGDDDSPAMPDDPVAELNRMLNK